MVKIGHFWPFWWGSGFGWDLVVVLAGFGQIWSKWLNRPFWSFDQKWSFLIILIKLGQDLDKKVVGEALF